MADQVTTEVTGTKKQILLYIIYVILAMIVIAQFIPESRAYTIEVVKIFLPFAQGIIK